MTREELSQRNLDRNVLQPIKVGEGSCLDCEWGTSLFGGGKGAVCLHTGKKNINELTRWEEWQNFQELSGKQFRERAEFMK